MNDLASAKKKAIDKAMPDEALLVLPSPDRINPPPGTRATPDKNGPLAKGMAEAESLDKAEGMMQGKAPEKPTEGLAEASALDKSEQDQWSAPPGTYKAKGDPYTYEVHDDGTVTIADGPSGKGMTLKSGTAHSAIMGQISSGQLSLSEPKK